MAKKKKESGFYQTTVKIFKDDGTDGRKNIAAKTMRELNDLKIEYANLYKERKEAFDIEAVAQEAVAFAELRDIFLTNYTSHLSDNARYNYEKKCNKYITPVVGDMDIRDINALHLQLIIDPMLKNNLAKATIKDYVMIARKIMEIGVNMRVIDANPFNDFQIPRGLTVTERRALVPREIALVNKHWRSHPMGLPALTMLYTGLRRGEMLAIKWTDIDLFNKVIHVDKAVSMVKENAILKLPKSKKGIRDIPIPDILHKCLVERLKSIKDENALLCPNDDGGYMNETEYKWAWEYYWRMLNEKAGGDTTGYYKKSWNVVIDKLTAHMFRHTYASLLYDANVDVKSAQSFLGHASVVTTLKIYTHLSESKAEKSIDSFNAMLNETFVE